VSRTEVSAAPAKPPDRGGLPAEFETATLTRRALQALAALTVLGAIVLLTPGLGEIRAELEQVRAESFAVCDNELDPGVLSYATPVPFGDGSVIYAIGISGLSERLRACPREEIRESLLNASKVLSKKLAH